MCSLVDWNLCRFLLLEYVYIYTHACIIYAVILEAEAIASHGQNGLAHLLLNYYGRVRPSPRPVPRVKQDAHNTAYRAKGSMKKHFTEMGKKQIIYEPGRQSKKYERTKTI